MEFNDQDEGEVKIYNPITDSSFFSSYNSQTELGEFLSRPVSILNLTWAENTDVNFVVNPWFRFFDDARIKKKIDNFSFLSCNLKVKLMINASPFYYGVGVMAYLPLSVFDAGNVSPASDEQLFGVHSQRPHVYFYPQSNQGGELTLPYINYKDWLDVGAQSDFFNMGNLNIQTIGNLRNANSVAGTGVSIQIYAWAEDVKLAGNTTGLALQSQDEYAEKNGSVSKPASAIARAMGNLSDVPVIGPYARASGMIASKISEVASWFGFTNTPIIDDSTPFHGKPFYGYASPEISIPVDKLCIDPKNELSIDPRVAGVEPDDEMMIAKIIEREAFLFQTEFDSINVVDDNILTIRVNPFMHNTVAAANQDIVQFTPMGHLSQMFKYWRGDIIYRFQFLASKYHRGRVRLSWDPTAATSADTVSATVNYTKIIDIAETPNFEIRVPYQQSTSYKLVD
eukprot:UN30639